MRSAAAASAMSGKRVVQSMRCEEAAGRRQHPAAHHAEAIVLDFVNPVTLGSALSARFGRHG